MGESLTGDVNSGGGFGIGERKHSSIISEPRTIRPRSSIKFIISGQCVSTSALGSRLDREPGVLSQRRKGRWRSFTISWMSIRLKLDPKLWHAFFIVDYNLNENASSKARTFLIWVFERRSRGVGGLSTLWVIGFLQFCVYCTTDAISICYS
jgi:hypothetical protein